MKTIFLYFAFTLIIVSGFAQPHDDSPLEVRLALLQHTNSKGNNELALSISVINHSNKDIYIPEFNNMVTLGGIHFYQKEQNKWREIDIFTQDYYHPPVQTHKTALGEFSDSHGEHPPMHFVNNEISNYYGTNVNKLALIQDSIGKKLYSSKKNLPSDFMNNMPLFLKAGQALDNLSVIDIDYLSTKPQEYKIAFNSEPRDSQVYHYRESTVYVSKDEKRTLPARFLEYQLYLPKDFISNVIYFSTIGIKK